MMTNELTVRPDNTGDAAAIADIVRRLCWFDFLAYVSKEDQMSQIGIAPSQQAVTMPA